MEIPGFIDLQVNGFKGVDFSSSDLTKDRFIEASEELIKTGTILFLPTIISSSEKIYEQNLRLISEVIDSTELANHIPGIHLEGPFLSDADGARGAHQSRWIKKPDTQYLDRLIEWSGEKIKLVTIAAELDGADDLCKYSRDHGITISLGHQTAIENDIDKLADSGATLLTHLGNGISQKIDRHHNSIWAGLANDQLMAMIITDGHHIPPSVIKTVLLAKGISKTIIVSDASPIAGLSPGRYQTLGNDVVLDKTGKLYNPETGYLVGSSSTMIDCMNYLHSLHLLVEEELLEVGYYNQLKLLDIDPKDIQSRFDSRIKLDKCFIFFNGSIF